MGTKSARGKNYCVTVVALTKCPDTHNNSATRMVLFSPRSAPHQTTGIGRVHASPLSRNPLRICLMHMMVNPFCLYPRAKV